MAKGAKIQIVLDADVDNRTKVCIICKDYGEFWPAKYDNSKTITI